ncbi:hypothetical protein BpHYR1_009720 [Brachionus plicatilis]|uniref:Uncharacterized protein n=1 Tax=Brachionus plicatilis TaxID=10195 RepID=A0A3M7Q8B5_BRAPC|nr:hypothetical protein BpHYR1_009720 [Brachionus plicatilis]
MRMHKETGNGCCKGFRNTTKVLCQQTICLGEEKKKQQKKRLQTLKKREKKRENKAKKHIRLVWLNDTCFIMRSKYRENKLEINTQLYGLFKILILPILNCFVQLFVSKRPLSHCTLLDKINEPINIKLIKHLYTIAIYTHTARPILEKNGKNDKQHEEYFFVSEHSRSSHFLGETNAQKSPYHLISKIDKVELKKLIYCVKGYASFRALSSIIYSQY